MSQGVVPDADAAVMAARLRLPVFTSVTVVLGIGAHVLAGGSPPTLGTLVLMVLVVASLARGLAGVERSFPWLLGALGAGQVGIHAALSSTHDHMAHLRSATPAMIAVHVLATVLIAAWLRRGEAAVWQALRRWMRVVLPPVPSIVVPTPAPWAAPTLVLPAPSWLATGRHARRGPPHR